MAAIGAVGVVAAATLVRDVELETVETEALRTV
jgi:hypothetical protein